MVLAANLESINYTPPWVNTSIIGLAGCSGSGKTTLAVKLVTEMNVPWVEILSMDSFYKPLTPEQSKKAFENEFDFDSPDAIDFDLLVDKLVSIRSGKRTQIPVYSFEAHQRTEETHEIYSPSVLILEGIFALHDSRILDMLDLKIYAEADSDLCLSRRMLRDVQYRGRDVEGCVKQWFSFVKPNFRQFGEPQRHIADIIVPRGVENTVAIEIIGDRIRKILAAKSHEHMCQLDRVRELAELGSIDEPMNLLPADDQIVNAMLYLENQASCSETDFVDRWNRLACLLLRRAVYEYVDAHTRVKVTLAFENAGLQYKSTTSMITKSWEQMSTDEYFTVIQTDLAELSEVAQISPLIVFLMPNGLMFKACVSRILPENGCGEILVENDCETGEPKLRLCKLSLGKIGHGSVKLNISPVILFAGYFRRGTAALMAIRVLEDFGVDQGRIIVVAYDSTIVPVRQILHVFPKVRILLARLNDGIDDTRVGWIHKRWQARKC